MMAGAPKRAGVKMNFLRVIIIPPIADEQIAIDEELLIALFRVII
jgi:hypothetical protein